MLIVVVDLVVVAVVAAVATFEIVAFVVEDLFKENKKLY